MTRMYLSPTATIFAKIGLLVVELIIGLFNVITYPIRKISLKTYGLIVLAVGVCYPVIFPVEIKAYAVALVIWTIAFTIGLFTIRAIHKVLNKKVSPRVAMMINSPLGIQLNRFYGC